MYLITDTAGKPERKVNVCCWGKYRSVQSLFTGNLCDPVRIFLQHVLVQFIRMVAAFFFSFYQAGFYQCFYMMTYRRLCKSCAIHDLGALDYTGLL